VVIVLVERSLASSGGKDNIGRVSAGDSTRRLDERWIHTARIYREGDAVSLPSLCMLELTVAELTAASSAVIRWMRVALR
jgi:hypothetical protein